MSTYYLAFKPYAELRSFCQSPATTSSLVLARSGWTSAGIYRDGPGTDFFSFASSLSLEVQKVGTEINKCLSTRTSSFLLLLTSGGLVVYLLLRRSGSSDEPGSSNQQDPKSNVETPTDGAPQNSHRGGNSSHRWNISSWLRWLFEDELLDGPSAEFDDIYVEGQYFGPADAKNNLGPERTRFKLLDLLNANLSRQNELTSPVCINTKRKTNDKKPVEKLRVPHSISSIPPPAVYVAPCPNCIRGTCHIRKHKQLRKYLGQQQQQNSNFEQHARSSRTSSGSSGTSNSSTGITSPLVQKSTDPYGFPLTNSITPYNADDENSEPESEMFDVDEKYFPYINQTCPVISLTEFKSQLLRPSTDERVGGNGESKSKSAPQSAKKKTKNVSSSKHSFNQQEDANSKVQSSKQSHYSKVPKARVRVPPEGKERLSQTQVPTTSSANHQARHSLSCGNIGCQDSFCLSQSNITTNISRYRDDSVDSLAGVSGSMVDLVKGAREVRRLIRETSMDSLCSEFSLSSYIGNKNMNPSEEIDYLVQIDSERFLNELSSIRTSCDELRDSLNTHPINTSKILPSSKSDFSINTSQMQGKLYETEWNNREIVDTGEESSCSDLKNLQRRLRPNRSREKKLWRLSAPISDVDSPQHLSNLTAEEDSSLEWESPSHGWHDLRHVKYKVALHQSRSQSLAASDCEDFDQWEWDTEGFGDEIGKDSFCNYAAINGVEFELSRGHDNWLPDKTFELDLESELGRVSFNGSINNSRRNSYCSNVSNSDFEGTDSICRQVRLPPSGRSSVAKGSSPTTGLTPSSSVDKDLLMHTFLNSTIKSHRTMGAGNYDATNHEKQYFSSYSKRPMRKSRSGSSLCNLSTSPILQTPVRNSVYGREKSPAPYSSQIINAQNSSTYGSRCSSEESGFQDFDKSFESSTLSNSSNSHVKSVGSNTSNSTIVAGTPLSPVHEAKEPRGSLDSPSPITSPLQENVSIEQFLNARRKLKLETLTKHELYGNRGNENSSLPDLETIDAV